MLARPNYVELWILRAIACLSLTAFSVAQLSADQVLNLINQNPSKVLTQYATNLSDEVSISAIVETMCDLRDFCVAQGCDFPTLPEILFHCRELAKKEGFDIPDDIFNILLKEFENRDKLLYSSPFNEIKHKHKPHKQKKKDIKISGKTAVGFLKFTAGTLLCLIPIPIVQGAGASLAVIGINDMVDGAKEDADKKDAEQRLEANRRVDILIER